jgi:hypothetical protein
VKDSRSASQILFGFLPEQTVDVRGGVWKVARWHVNQILDVDADALRRALITAAAPWEATGLDGNFVRAMRSGADVRVHSLDRDRGVTVEAFPKKWRCKSEGCGRLHDTPGASCPCGTKARHGQLPFVLFHDACGEIREPFYPACPQHGQVRMRLPGTANPTEIRLSCPICSAQLTSAFLYTKCRCGQTGSRPKGELMEFNVHRAAAVYAPRAVVLINPASKAQARRLADAGGDRAALTWVADAMNAEWVDRLDGGEAVAIRREFERMGLSESRIAAALTAAGVEEKAPQEVVCPPAVAERARLEAGQLALATSESRLTVAQMLARAPASLKDRFGRVYPAALASAKVERVDLIDRFPILTGHFGYTRGNQDPGQSRLRVFKDKTAFVVNGDLGATEALLFRLDPRAVRDWLNRRGHALEPATDSRSAYEAILRAVGPDPDASPITRDVTILVHSISHRTVRHSAFFAGIDRNALSELLFPATLSFIMYAVPRGGFVLGGLQALYENDLHELMTRVVHDESRCALDPGCAANPGGAACAVCLHLGEPSCRMFNTALDRKVMFGAQGYFSN